MHPLGVVLSNSPDGRIGQLIDGAGSSEGQGAQPNLRVLATAGGRPHADRDLVIVGPRRHQPHLVDRDLHPSPPLHAGRARRRTADDVRRTDRGCRHATSEGIPRRPGDHPRHGPVVDQWGIGLGDRRIPEGEDIAAGARNRLRRGREAIRCQRALPPRGRHARVGLGDFLHLAKEAQPLRLQRVRPGPAPPCDRLRVIRGWYRFHGEVHQGVVPDSRRSLVGRPTDPAEHAAVLVLFTPLGGRREPDRDRDPSSLPGPPVDQVRRTGRRRSTQRSEPSLGPSHVDRRRDPSGDRVRRDVENDRARFGGRRGDARTSRSVGARSTRGRGAPEWLRHPVASGAGSERPRTDAVDERGRAPGEERGTHDHDRSVSTA